MRNVLNINNNGLYTPLVVDMNKRTIVVIFLLSFVIVFPNIIPKEGLGISSSVDPNDVTILVLLDFNFGANYVSILNQFEAFGWTVTTAAPAATITGCEYNSVEFNADLLFSEISAVTSYDCVNVMPGSSHDNLMANQDSILNTIKTASDAGVIISGWCRAVRVLAAANVISGENVTGHSDYAAEYIAAGADFYSNSPPIISNNIVTVSSTQFYMKEMFIAMTHAIGCYENNAPVLGLIDVQSFANNSRLLTVNIVDESILTEVKAILELTSSDSDPPPLATKTLTLSGPDAENNYTIMFTESSHGFYSVDLEITDIYWNEFTFNNITTIEVGVSAEASIGFIVVLISFPVIATLIIIRKKKSS